jgi:hypothetical protein
MAEVDEVESINHALPEHGGLRSISGLLERTVLEGLANHVL